MMHQADSFPSSDVKNTELWRNRLTRYLQRKIPGVNIFLNETNRAWLRSLINFPWQKPDFPSTQTDQDPALQP